jgi:ribonuclease HI
MNCFECQGNIRIDVIMSINNSQFKPISEFKRSLEVLKVIEHLPSLALPNNMQLTANALLKYSEVFGAVNVCRNEYGVITITPNHRLLSKMVMKSTGITHRSQLTNGIVTKHNPLIGIPVPPFKTGKRLALVSGLEVKGVIPTPNSIDVVELPDGVIIVSPTYAANFKLLDRYGNTIPLSNGDKLSGVIGEYLVKGTALIDPKSPVDLLLGKDAVKAVDCECEDNLHIQLLAEDRVSYNASLTYEFWCWHLDLLEKRIKSDMARPYRYTAIVDNPLDSDQLASYDHPHNTNMFFDNVVYTTTREVPNLKLFLQGKACNESYASLHIWRSPEGQLMVSEKAYKQALVKGCGIQEQLKMKNLIADLMSHKIKGAWGVANWNQQLGDDIISLPHSVWLELGKPAQVAVSRSPFIECIKLNVVSHFDAQDFRVSMPIMELLAGDLDGDLILVAANKDIVEVSPTFAQAEQLHRPFMAKIKTAFEWIKKQHSSFHLKDYNTHCNRYGLYHAIVRTDEQGIEYCMYPDAVLSDNEVDARYAQHYLAFECQMVPQASVIITNMLAWGKLDRPTFIKMYRLLKQASLDQQDGGFPMFNLLISNFLNSGEKQSYISRLTGIDDKTLKTFIPNVTPFIITRNPVARYTAKGFCPSEIKTVLEVAGKTKSPFSKMIKMFECLVDNEPVNDDTGGNTPVKPYVKHLVFEYDDKQYDIPCPNFISKNGNSKGRIIDASGEPITIELDGIGLRSITDISGSWCKIIHTGWGDPIKGRIIMSNGEFMLEEQHMAQDVVDKITNDVDNINTREEFIEKLPQYRIYTDGSKQGDGPITWAFAVIDTSDGILHEASGVIPMDTYDESRNIAGEVYAVCQALEWADANHHINITICHDYNGISKWANHEWKAKKPISQFLLHQLSLHKHINITWVKIKAHSGDAGNELVDLLAKQAAELNQHDDIDPDRREYVDKMEKAMDYPTCAICECEVPPNTLTLDQYLSSGNVEDAEAARRLDGDELRGNDLICKQCLHG